MDSVNTTSQNPEVLLQGHILRGRWPLALTMQKSRAWQEQLEYMMNLCCRLQGCTAQLRAHSDGEFPTQGNPCAVSRCCSYGQVLTASHIPSGDTTGPDFMLRGYADWRWEPSPAEHEPRLQSVLPSACFPWAAVSVLTAWAYLQHAASNSPSGSGHSSSFFPASSPFRSLPSNKSCIIILIIIITVAVVAVVIIVWYDFGGFFGTSVNGTSKASPQGTCLGNTPYWPSGLECSAASSGSCNRKVSSASVSSLVLQHLFFFCFLLPTFFLAK